MPSLDRQGHIDRATLYETDILQLLHHQPIDHDGSSRHPRSTHDPAGARVNPSTAISLLTLLYLRFLKPIIDAIASIIGLLDRSWGSVSSTLGVELGGRGSQLPDKSANDPPCWHNKMKQLAPALEWQGACRHLASSRLMIS
jgi:hypothetical protein